DELEELLCFLGCVVSQHQAFRRTGQPIGVALAVGEGWEIEERKVVETGSLQHLDFGELHVYDGYFTCCEHVSGGFVVDGGGNWPHVFSQGAEELQTLDVARIGELAGGWVVVLSHYRWIQDALEDAAQVVGYCPSVH